MANDDITRHPLWRSALCWKCGEPMKLDDLRQKAQRLGMIYPPGQPRYHIYCCNEPTIEDNQEYQAIVSLLRRYYGV